MASPATPPVLPVRPGRAASLALLAALLATASCNEILGIHPGEASGGAGGAGGSGAGMPAGGAGGAGGAGPCAGLGGSSGHATRWVRQAVGSYDDRGLGVAVAPGSGDVIVAGTYADDDFTIDTEPLPYPSHPDEPGEQENVFVARYTAEGKPVWALGLPGRETQRILSVAADGAGSALVGGYFLNTFDVGVPLTADASLSPVAIDGFALKIDPSGSVLWSRQFGGASTDEVAAVADDGKGNTYVLGVSLLGGDIQMPPASVEAEYGCGPRTLMASTPTVFVTKLDAFGGCVWDKQIVVDTRFYGIYGPPAGLAMAVDPGGDVVITAGFSGSVVLGGGLFIGSAGDKDVLLARLSGQDGEAMWATSFGDESYQVGGAVAVDADGDIWVGGNFQKRVVFDPLPAQADPLLDANNWKAFLVKLEHAADPMEPPVPVYLRTLTDAGWQQIRSIVAAPDGDVVIGGVVHDAGGAEGVDFGDGNKEPPPGADPQGNFSDDGFVARYCKNGGLRWARRLSTPYHESVLAVAAGSDGLTYANGSFGAKYDFGAGQALTPADIDVFTLAIGPQ